MDKQGTINKWSALAKRPIWVLAIVMVATFATAIFLIVRNKATEQETLDMLYDDDIWP